MEILGFILTVAIAGGLLFLPLYTWLSWYTDGDYKRPIGNKKDIITFLGLGILSYILKYL